MSTKNNKACKKKQLRLCNDLDIPDWQFVPIEQYIPETSEYSLDWDDDNLEKTVEAIDNVALHKERNLEQQQQQQLPILLYKRERGSNYPGLLNRSKFNTYLQECLMMNMFSKNNLDKVNKNQNYWRKYCHRRIPFTELGTPKHDAVLDLDPSGSYMICIGGKYIHSEHTDDLNDSIVNGGFELNTTRYVYNSKLRDVVSITSCRGPFCRNHQMQLSVALRFYGVLSPSSQYRIEKSIGQQESTRLLTIPISYKEIIDSNTNNYHDEFVFAPPPALIPIRIWLSADCVVGVAAVRLWSHERWVGVRKISN